MPLLATMILNLFWSIVNFFLQFVTRKAAIILSAIAIMIAATTTFIAGINALVAGIQVAAPAQVSIAMGMFLPSNTESCVSAILSAHLLKWAWMWQLERARQLGATHL